MNVKLVVGGVAFVALVIAAFTVDLKPPRVTDIVDEFHGKATTFSGLPGQPAGKIKSANDNLAFYSFTAPAGDVKAGLIRKLKDGGWDYSEPATGWIRFFRNHGNEYGFFAFDRKLFPQETADTTCILSVQKQPG